MKEDYIYNMRYKECTKGCFHCISKQVDVTWRCGEVSSKIHIFKDVYKGTRTIA